MKFLKVTPKRYISFDGQFEIVSIGGGLWTVSKKNQDDKYFSLYIDHPFSNFTSAMAQLKKVYA
jgi:hypothetical protein